MEKERYEWISRERHRNGNKETDRHKPLHMLKHRWEQSDRGQSTGRRERVGRQGREGETDMEPKPPNEPTPRKDRHFSV